ncbi:site-2 protease family protein [Tenacibaculum skagerrakense]|nr:site-2 protease family protein [Tenacibaculum skagerrakense]
MKANLNLGSIAGIHIKIHWTFVLLFAWIVFSEMKRGNSTEHIFYHITLIIAVFICVLLHELGHALMAKKYNISTKKITLLPIGGIASLEKMPENPKEEFLVSLAGPFVNFLIAIVLYFCIPVKEFLDKYLLDNAFLMSELNIQSFLFYLFFINVGLMLFNLIPAFPMDGGRILRALLTLKTNRVKATYIASLIGQFFAVIFLLIGLVYNPFLIFIALFIFVGAFTENKIIQQLNLIKGHTVKEAMMTNITTFNPSDSIDKVIDAILKGTEKDFVVVLNSKVVGIILHNDIIENSSNRNCLVKDIMKVAFKSLKSNDDLKLYYEFIQTNSTFFLPVIDNSELVGVLDINNLNEYLLIQAKLT